MKHRKIAIAVATGAAVAALAGCSGTTSNNAEGPDVVVGHKFGDKALFERTIRANLSKQLSPDRVTGLGCTKTGDVTARCIVSTVRLGKNGALIEVSCSYIDTDDVAHDCMWQEV